MNSTPTMTASQVLARVAVLVAAWGVVWAVTPRAVLSSPAASFAWWTTMKGLVWFALAAALLRPDGPRAWLGEYRGRIGNVLVLAAVWILLDSAAVWIGLKAPVVAPSWATLLAGWNATLNVLVIAPLFEELLFRGLVWSRLEAASLRRVHVWLLSATAFGALHVPGWVATQGVSPLLLSQFALVFLAGLFCGAGRWVTGSVWGSVLLHAANNLASLGLFHR